MPATLTLNVRGNRFVDEAGRTVLLRGVNLSGCSKTPIGQPSHQLGDFWESAEKGGKSFVGRPFDLDDGTIDIHLARLRGWGFNFLRYSITWEALEHEGPGKYDHEFIDYTIAVLRKCKEHGFKVYIDPHEDCWSRFSGGSGAPYWTIPACGLNPRNFSATKAAILHCEHEPEPSEFPTMLWCTNGTRLACQTLFTLFFAGKDFAPLCIIDGMNIQDYLQSHFLEAFGTLADRIWTDARDLLDECIVGWDSINEPSPGFIGWEDVNALPGGFSPLLKKGPMPTPAQSLLLGVGLEQSEIEEWDFGQTGPSKVGTITINPEGKSIWQSPESEEGGFNSRWGWKRDERWKLGECIWAQHGVWDAKTGEVLDARFFTAVTRDVARHPVDFIADYWRPHFLQYVERIRKSHRHMIPFIQPSVFEKPPPFTDMERNIIGERACYSPHYYNGMTVLTRSWQYFNTDAVGIARGKFSSILPINALSVGNDSIRKSIRDQLALLKSDAGDRMPTIIGEMGVPFDMKGKSKGDYSEQAKALDACMNGCDGANVLSCTLWNYCPDNTHQWGDGWNGEDMSIWSPDDVEKRSSSTASEQQSANRFAYDLLVDGARAVTAFCRPYPVRTVGVPTSMEFDVNLSDFHLTVLVTKDDFGGAELPTEIFLPFVHYALLDSAEHSSHTSDALPSENHIPADAALEHSAGRLCDVRLDLAVQVSVGRWEVAGQYLRWFYPRPESASSEYSLKVRRSAGATAINWEKATL